MPTTPWLPRDPNPNAQRHLLCLPYSGAPCTVFDNWRIPGVDVLPLILPGRGPRREEPLVSSLWALAEDIVDSVLPLLPRPYDLLGHSMGAWLAHAVASLVDERGDPHPTRLFVLSAPPPHLGHRRFSSLHGLPDADMVTEVIRLGGAPESARDTIHANVDIIRADATAVGRHQPAQRTLSCPITAIGGTRDELFDLNDLMDWRTATSAPVSIHLLDAGHFTVTERQNEIIRITAQDSTATTQSPDPIAVIGMACRLPGADTPAAFWDLLRDGRTAVGPVPPERTTNDTQPLMHVGGFLDNVDQFDAEYFGFTTREAHRSDPRLRLLLMTVQEAIDDAGLAARDLAGPRSGVWVAESHSDYWDLATPVLKPNMYTLSGGGLKSFLSGRVSHCFDLQGPSITLDTSCSASLTAVHTACRALRNGEVDAALAAGTHLILNPDAGPSHGLAKALSPRGRSAFASDDADGYPRAEGVAVLLLRRLSDALANADPIHAVIEGSAINANGQSGRNIVTTSVPGQVRMMREALADAGCVPADIAYVEAHGPGTPTGDEVELAALDEVYGANPATCLVGSVKTNIGHLEPVAGIAGLLKAILAVRHGQVPASLHHSSPTPAIDWERSALRVPTGCEPWPATGPGRAAVSSFGLSGANAHAIVAAPPAQNDARARLPQRTWNLRSYWFTEVAGQRPAAEDETTAPPPSSEPATVHANHGGDPMPADLFFRTRLPVWAELDELLDNPEFTQDLASVSATYQRLQAFGRRLGPARELHRDPERLLAGMEWAGIVDPALMHAAMVHYGVATTTLVECGDTNPDLHPLLRDLDRLEAPGAIVATELGRGGSQVHMRTEARYQRDRGTFTLHTPDDAAVKIMPNVGWTGLPRTAVVNARLLVDDTDHGIHAFAFRFPHPQARVTMLPGGAPVPLDYSTIRFRDAEIPYGYWLADTATITGDGVTDPCTPQQRLARSLVGVNAAVTAAAVALTSAARATVATATRYTSQRLIGHPGAPAINLSTHSTELASAVARVYATTCYVDRVRRDFVHERLQTDSGDTSTVADSAQHAPWLAANRDRTLAKAAAATTLESVAGTCRRLCGFQGILHTNRIAVYEDMARSFHSAGGDTRLLLLEAGKQLIGGTSPPSAPRAVPTDLEHEHAAVHLVAFQEGTLIEQLQRLVDQADPSPHLLEIEQLARVHLNRRILEEFDAALTTVQGQRHTMLDAARRLYGLDTLLASAAWHLNQGSLRPGDVDVLRQAHARVSARVARWLPRLVDGLAVPPGRVGGFIGRDDYVSRIAAVPG
ncbi:beta-ketoacyl synthase N-terminal-like domain-containing protein [Lipingzhangella sp. LS1_29]|uniref:Beta-ketoacyl synthase N-terminal-like domain-containing protein n=1 Tax=Lipingzhangella rawalii TaxID=2055835 RepID=A0ABU2H496_9ACTN|nr:beta-ketoacyl synthase N-terminal-like domain-containing protein [Lipingzhangella rawalii]MDS1270127.1 beta-ketoacyl synthase N-terminal-like domain-containing protein [Lipingzhangella rawalii]